jgi:hypothetical protein
VFIECRTLFPAILLPFTLVDPWALFLTILFRSPGRVKLARHCRSGKLAAVKILDLHPTLSSRASALANAGDKAEKMILTAEREIAVMKVCCRLILSALAPLQYLEHSDPISSFSFSRPATAP